MLGTMRLRSFLLGAAIGFANAQQPSKDAPFGRGCLVPAADPSINEAEATNQALTASSRLTSLPESMDVDVYFHIASTVNDTNLITQEILDAQWTVLYEAYIANNINLTLVSTDRIVSDRAGQFFTVDESTGEYPNYVTYEEERNEYLSSSRLGGYDALNIFFFSRYLPGATGYCTFPAVRDANDTEVIGMDGCAVSGLTMPGITIEQGAFPEYNQGHVTVHEAGHWYVNVSTNRSYSLPLNIDGVD